MKTDIVNYPQNTTWYTNCVTPKIKDTLERLGFSDSSFINDACPSFESRDLRLYIDAEDPQQRECDTRFYLYQQTVDGDVEQDLYEGDSFKEVLIAIAEFIAD